MVQKKLRNIINQKTVVVTRPEHESKLLTKMLKTLGFNVFIYPSIRISKPPLSLTDKEKLRNVESYDWIVFTSRNGVVYFLNALQELKIDALILKAKKIASVGPATALELTKNNINVHFIPSKFTTSDLARELSGIENKKILLPRANIATRDLTRRLEKRGATVVDISIYQTNYISEVNETFEKLILENEIKAIIFTSPSTVRGLIGNLNNDKLRKKVLTLPVFSIGSVTTKSAKRFGFATIHTSKTHTIDGLLLVIRKSNLC